MHAIVTTPAEPVGACFAHFPIDDSLPRIPVGSACRITHFEACSTFTRYKGFPVCQAKLDPDELRSDSSIVIQTLSFTAPVM